MGSNVLGTSPKHPALIAAISEEPEERCEFTWIGRTREEIEALKIFNETKSERSQAYWAEVKMIKFNTQISK